MAGDADAAMARLTAFVTDQRRGLHSAVAPFNAPFTFQDYGALQDEEKGLANLFVFEPPGYV